MTLVSSFLPPSHFPSSSTLGKDHAVNLLNVGVVLTDLLSQLSNSKNMFYRLCSWVEVIPQIKTQQMLSLTVKRGIISICMHPSLCVHCTLQPHLRLMTSAHMLFKFHNNVVTVDHSVEQMAASQTSAEPHSIQEENSEKPRLLTVIMAPFPNN